MLKLIRQNYILFVIILLGLFFRIFRFKELYGYGHEQDLQAFIAKDILVDKHFRLIGQETSITGLFIGPIYYYIMAFFFWIFGMNPLSFAIPITFISTATLVSVFWITKKLYGKDTAIPASIIYAASSNIAFLDRWIVPTQPTLLWTVWFFYCLMIILRKDYTAIPILIVLFGLIWHIHIAFIPYFLILSPLAFFLSRGSLKNLFSHKRAVYFSFGTFILFITPFIAFEIRHGFGQINALATAFSSGGEYAEIRSGYYKLYVIIEHIDRVLREPFSNIRIFPYSFAGFFLLVFGLWGLKKITREEAAIFIAWVVLTIAVHFFSKRAMSEYYFNNLIILSVTLFGLFYSFVIKIKGLLFPAVFLLGFFVLINFSALNQKQIHGEYKDKLDAVTFIKESVEENNYPCVGINYIGELGVSYGYRYLFWWKKVIQIAPGNDVPTYSIVRPWTISENEVNKVFGDIGVIIPKKMQVDPSICIQENRQLLPLNGFVN